MTERIDRQQKTAPHDDAQPRTTVILVHGAFSDGSSWRKVIPLLHDAGLAVIAVQNPLTSLKDDTEHTLRAINSAEGPVVLVGHSWGGVVITEAGAHEKVKTLVYVSSYAPAVGQSLMDVANDYGIPECFSAIVSDENGYLRLPEKAMQAHFAPDVPADEIALMTAVQGRMNGAALSETVANAAWQSKPSWFVISENDQFAPVAMQTGLAEKIGAKQVRLATGHAPMTSSPEGVSAAIIAAANDF